jgi:hypothetical protein
LRTITIAAALGILFAASTSGAMAESRLAHSSRDSSGWITQSRHEKPATPQYEARSRWIVAKLPEECPARSGWIKNDDKDKPEIKHQYVFRDNDHYRSEGRYRMITPDGNPAAVPEPSGILGLAGPMLGGLLCWKRRRRS